MQRLQSCCLGTDINTGHAVEGQKDPNMFAPLRWSEVKFLYCKRMLVIKNLWAKFFSESKKKIGDL